MSEDNDLAQQVVDMRDKGISWNQIGLDLNLVENAGDPANYKKRAAAARSLYKKLNGGKLPDSGRAPRQPREDGETPKRSRSGVPKRPEFSPKGEASGKLVEMTEEELLELLPGRTVQWTTIIGPDGNFLDTNDDHTNAEYYPNECIVGRNSLRIIEAPRGRAITFNEPEAGSRSIYLHRIHTVK